MRCKNTHKFQYIAKKIAIRSRQSTYLHVISDFRRKKDVLFLDTYHHAETEVLRLFRAEEELAGGVAQIVWCLKEGPATHGTLLQVGVARLLRPLRVGRRRRRILAIPVCAPLHYIARHIIQSQCIGLQQSRLMHLSVGVLLRPTHQLCTQC